MKKWIVVAALTLSGCAQISNYDQAVKTPAPLQLQGNWQTQGPQRALVSEHAMASLIISPAGDTLDCRQWQRVIAKPGKLTTLSGDYVNVTKQLRVMPLALKNGELHYDGLVMRKVERPTLECEQALAAVQENPQLKMIQNIEPAIMRPEARSAGSTP